MCESRGARPGHLAPHDCGSGGPDDPPIRSGEGHDARRRVEVNEDWYYSSLASPSASHVFGDEIHSANRDPKPSVAHPKRTYRVGRGGVWE